MNTVKHKYGNFKKTQILKHMKHMRKKIFWLIIYTDNNTNEKFKNVDVVSYHIHLMEELDGLNSLLFYPAKMVELLSTLEEALLVLKHDDFDFKKYRTLVLDAGAMLERFDL